MPTGTQVLAAALGEARQGCVRGRAAGALPDIGHTKRLAGEGCAAGVPPDAGGRGGCECGHRRDRVQHQPAGLAAFRRGQLGAQRQGPPHDEGEGARDDGRAAPSGTIRPRRVELCCLRLQLRGIPPAPCDHTQHARAVAFRGTHH
eukprot:1747203-Prymnesium_polylepis.2